MIFLALKLEILMTTLHQKFRVR